MAPKEVIELGKKNGAVIVDLKFMDLPGLWQHYSVPFHELKEESFEEGFGFDASSLRGWQPIHASDMLLIPDPNTAKIDPFMTPATLSLICNIVDPITHERYSRDPRYVAEKAEAYMKSAKIADTAYFGPEAEFFILDEIRFDQNQHSGYYFLDSEEGFWNTGREEKPNLGYKPRYKEGYFPAPPTDSLQNLRSEMVMELERLGLRVEAHHHEVATGGQAEIDLRYAPLIEMGDNLMWFKYVVKNVARRNKKTATFMPKPIFGDNGSGMHVHCSLWKANKPLFAGDKYGGLSELALNFIAGIIRHAPAVCAFTNPTTNSYRRLVPGFEAPINLAYSSRNRSAAIRIPMYSPSPSSKRIEIRFPDPSCNGYLAFSALLMAGLDGIEKKLPSGEPLDKDIYGLSPEELKDVPNTPASLEEALRALEEDNDFLLKGNVFTKDLLEMWIGYKMKKEVSEMRLRPTPWEFALYFDC